MHVTSFGACYTQKGIKLKIKLLKDFICLVFLYFAAWSSFHVQIFNRLISSFFRKTLNITYLHFNKNVQETQNPTVHLQGHQLTQDVDGFSVPLKMLNIIKCCCNTLVYQGRGEGGGWNNKFLRFCKKLYEIINDIKSRRLHKNCNGRLTPVKYFLILLRNESSKINIP